MAGAADETSLVNLLERARSGCGEARGWLIESCRDHLLHITSEELPPALRQKVADSDLVQTVAVEAFQGFDAFRGKTEEELRGWLRRILLRNLADAARCYRTGKRSLEIEQDLPKTLPESVRIAPVLTPSEEVSRSEEALQIERALARLPHDYQQVLHLRNRDGLSFPEIGARLNRSAEAVRKLWQRGLERLQRNLKTQHERNELG